MWQCVVCDATQSNPNLSCLLISSFFLRYRVSAVSLEERERERDGKSDILLLKVGPISISPSLNHILSPSLSRIIPRTPSNHRPPSLPLHPSTGTMTTMASLDSLSFSPSSNSHPSSHPSLTIKRDYAVTKQPFNTKDSRCIITAV